MPLDVLKECVVAIVKEDSFGYPYMYMYSMWCTCTCVLEPRPDYTYSVMYMYIINVTHFEKRYLYHVS